MIFTHHMINDQTVADAAMTTKVVTVDTMALPRAALGGVSVGVNTGGLPSVGGVAGDGVGQSASDTPT